MAHEQRTFRALGGVDEGTLPPTGEVADALRAEFDRALALKASLRGEAEAPVSPTGRRTTAADEAKLRTLVASVEGASRFAIRLRLLAPSQVRALWAEAIRKGLYDGWDAGQSAYTHAAAEAAGGAPGTAADRELGTAADRELGTAAGGEPGTSQAGAEPGTGRGGGAPETAADRLGPPAAREARDPVLGRGSRDPVLGPEG